MLVVVTQHSMLKKRSTDDHGNVPFDEITIQFFTHL